MNDSALTGQLLPQLGEDCFLCEPENWRVLYAGKHLRLIAGLGPLTSGYVLLAPAEHIRTTVDQPADVYFEFGAVQELLLAAFQHQYGSGYTAYEHGRLGSCRLAEHTGAHGSFCFHSHRVFIPIDVRLELAPHFQESIKLDDRSGLRSWSGAPYVYYEHGVNAQPSEIFIFSDAPTLPSQFMRKQIGSAIRRAESWDWSVDLGLLGVLATVRALRPEFVGLDYPGPPAGSHFQLRRSVFIDGLSCVGKTTLAAAIGAAAGRPVFNSGLVFRHIARRGWNGDFNRATVEHFAEAVLEGDQPALRTPEITRQAAEAARSSENRKLCEDVTQWLLANRKPCIVTGRDAWKQAQDDDICLLVDAPFDLRVRRLFLDRRRQGEAITLADAHALLETVDAADFSRLPPPTRAVRLSNGRRPFEASVREVFELIAGGRP